MRSAECSMNFELCKVQAMETEKRGSVVFIHIKQAYNQNKMTPDAMQLFMQALDEAES